MHSAMRIVRVPRFEAFRISSLAIGESIVYHELLHDTFTLYPLFKAPSRCSRILELYNVIIVIIIVIVIIMMQFIPPIHVRPAGYRALVYYIYI